MHFGQESCPEQAFTECHSMGNLQLPLAPPLCHPCESLPPGRLCRRDPWSPSPAQQVPQGQQHLTPKPWRSPRPVPTRRAEHLPLTCWSWELWVTLARSAVGLGTPWDTVRFGALRNIVDHAQARSSAIPLRLGCSCFHRATAPVLKSEICKIFVRKSIL